MGAFTCDYIKFQSTPPRGRRRKLNGVDRLQKVNFNPRLREGGDLFGRRISTDLRDFNPRLREGGDFREESNRGL